MALSFGTKGSPKGPARMEDVTALISKKNYTRAIEVIREQLKVNARDPRLRLQLGDVLVMAGKGPQAIVILDPLADEFAREGFAAKAISVLKKIQRIDPGRRDVDKRLASLIEEKQRVATVSLPSPSSGFPEIGMEEIGMDFGGSSVAVPAAELPPESEAPAPELAVAVAEPAPAAPGPAPALEATPEFDFGGASEPILGVNDPLPIAVELPAPVEDRDLILGDDDFVEAEEEAPGQVEPEPAAVDPMTDNAFADELMSVIDDAFSGLAATGDEAPALEGLPQDTGLGNQIVVSPLFRHFSVDEMVAVIQGLKLMSFEKGKVIIRQGEKGDSLYMLTAGSVRAFAKKDGKQVKLGDLEEGAFFGEVSILTGKPRSATIVALVNCELLELDRPTLDGIVKKHPHVLEVMQEFGKERTARCVMGPGGSGPSC
jgi:hypothetical protein